MRSKVKHIRDGLVYYENGQVCTLDVLEQDYNFLAAFYESVMADRLHVGCMEPRICDVERN